MTRRDLVFILLLVGTAFATSCPVLPAQITSCGCTMDVASATYQIRATLTHSGGICLESTADKTDLDMNQQGITNTGTLANSYGILVNTKQMKIWNGDATRRIKGEDYGIYVNKSDGAYNNLYFDGTVGESTAQIYLNTGATSSVIYRPIISTNTTGIIIVSSASVTIDRPTITSNTTGIDISGAASKLNSISGGTITSPTLCIALTDTNATTISGVTMTATGKAAAVLLARANYSNINGNAITPSSPGISLTATSNWNTIGSNTISGVGSPISVASSSYNTIYSNGLTTTGANNIPISISGASYNNTIYSNTFTGGATSGNYVLITGAATGNMFYSNTFSGASSKAWVNATNSSTRNPFNTTTSGLCVGNIYATNYGINASFNVYHTGTLPYDYCDYGTCLFNTTNVPFSKWVGTTSSASDACPRHGRHFAPTNVSIPFPANNTIGYTTTTCVVNGTGSLYGALFASAKFEIDGVNYTASGNATNFNYSINATGIPRNITAWLCGSDYYGSTGCNKSASINFTCTVAHPGVSIISPLNVTYNTTSIQVNISAVNATSVWYNWNGTNSSYSTPHNDTFPIGANTLFAYANNSIGEIVSASVNFTVAESKVIRCCSVLNRRWHPRGLLLISRCCSGSCNN